MECLHGPVYSFRLNTLYSFYFPIEPSATYIYIYIYVSELGTSHTIHKPAKLCSCDITPPQVDAISDAADVLTTAVEKFDKIHKDFQNRKKGPKGGKKK